VPEVGKNLLGVPDASYLRPLLYGLRSSSADLEFLVDIPSQLAIKLQKRTEFLRCAFLSPIDYARHGADYLIVPRVAISSSSGSGTIQLFFNRNVRNVETMAVDIRVTSEIILAKIILAEKFPNLSAGKGTLQVVPMLPRREEMLRKSDAALVVNFHPFDRAADEPFALDLVEEWNDLTDLPYVHGLWIGHDEPESASVVEELIRAKEAGTSHLGETVHELQRERTIQRKASEEYLQKFAYDLGEKEQEALTEFIRLAYYHGVLPDAPDLNFFDVDLPPEQSVN
jgi:chorismate dehydratase